MWGLPDTIKGDRVGVSDFGDDRCGRCGDPGGPYVATEPSTFPRSIAALLPSSGGTVAAKGMRAADDQSPCPRSGRSAM